MTSHASVTRAEPLSYDERLLALYCKVIGRIIVIGSNRGYDDPYVQLLSKRANRIYAHIERMGLIRRPD